MKYPDCNVRLVKRIKPGGAVDLNPSWISWKNLHGPSQTSAQDCLVVQARFTHFEIFQLFYVIYNFPAVQSGMLCLAPAVKCLSANKQLR